MVDGNRKMYLPSLYPYSDVFREILRQRKIDTTVLPQTSALSIETGKKYVQGNENHSLTALLGDVFMSIENGIIDTGNTSVFIPQTEGAEVDGQYARLVRAKLDGTGLKNVGIVSLFIEDLIFSKDIDYTTVLGGLLASDCIRMLPEMYGRDVFEKIKELIHSDKFDIDNLKVTVRSLKPLSTSVNGRKKKYLQ